MVRKVVSRYNRSFVIKADGTLWELGDNYVCPFGFDGL